MSEENNAAVADQPQGGSDNEHSSFIGDDTQLDEFASETQPETSEADEEGEGEAAVSEAQEEGEAEGEEGAEQQSVDDWLKDLTQRESESYQKRYPTAWKALNDPDTPEDLKALLRDKINTDREIERRKAEELDDASEVEDEGEDEEEQAATAQPADAKAQREQYQTHVRQLVQATADPEALRQLGMNLLAGFGVDVTKTDDPEVKALLDNAPKVASTLAEGFVDMAYTALPQLMPTLVEAVFPGFGLMYERSLYSSQWDRVREYTDESGKQPYAELPPYGSKDFKRTLKEAAKQIEGFDEMVFRDKNGNPLPLAQQATKKYSILARIATGQKVNPEVVAQAVETGRRLAGESEQRRRAGRALGSGKSTQRIEQGGGGDDGVLSALDAEIQRNNANLTPFGSRR